MNTPNKKSVYYKMTVDVTLLSINFVIIIAEGEDQPSCQHSSVSVNPTMRPCINARWSANDSILITHTPKTIALNNAEGHLIQRVDTERYEDILCCTLFRDRFTVAAVCSNGVYNVVLIDNRTHTKMMTVEETDKVIDILVVPGK